MKAKGDFVLPFQFGCNVRAHYSYQYIQLNGFSHSKVQLHLITKCLTFVPQPECTSTNDPQFPCFEHRNSPGVPEWTINCKPSSLHSIYPRSCYCCLNVVFPQEFFLKMLKKACCSTPAQDLHLFHTFPYELDTCFSRHCYKEGQIPDSSTAPGASKGSQQGMVCSCLLGKARASWLPRWMA